MTLTSVNVGSKFRTVLLERDALDLIAAPQTTESSMRRISVRTCNVMTGAPTMSCALKIIATKVRGMCIWTVAHVIYKLCDASAFDAK